METKGGDWRDERWPRVPSRHYCGFCLPLAVHTVPPPLSLSPIVNRASDGTLPIPSLVLLFASCSHLYPSSSSCWPWPAQGSHTIPLGSSAHRRYAALFDVKPHRTVQRPIRRPVTPTSRQASSRWFSQATNSESAAASSFAVGSIVLMVAERTTVLYPLETSTSASQLTQRHQTFGSSRRSATLLNASPCPNIL
jgi:hypothetical protein